MALPDIYFRKGEENTEKKVTKISSMDNFDHDWARKLILDKGFRSNNHMLYKSPEFELEQKICEIVSRSMPQQKQPHAP
jgi:hypothetical protein